jgi:hypothetical protein
MLPIRPGLPEKADPRLQTHGTTTLFAALEVATGLVTDRCYQQHTNVEFLTFLKQVAAPTRGAAAPGLRQLRHPQAPQRARLAGQAPRVTAALHPTIEAG